MSSRLTAIFKPSKPRQKILVSPGYGAGWVTWAFSDDTAFLAWMVTYQPLIDHVEDDARFQESRDRTQVQCWKSDEYVEASRWREYMALEKASILEQFDREAKGRFGVQETRHCGVKQLRVAEVDGPFMLMEYDGSESVVYLAHRDIIPLG